MSATPSTEDREPASRPAENRDSGGRRPDAPRWLEVARRPRWIAALLLCLAIAVSFAALGQWQISRAVDRAAVTGPETERAVPLREIDEPQTAVTGAEAGRIATVSGRLAPADSAILEQRLRVGTLDGTGDRGFWLVGRLIDDDGTSVAVALGWSATRGGVERARDALEDAPVELTGRYQPGESPTQDDFEAGQRSALAPAALLNEWDDPGPVFNGFLVADEPVAGLTEITAPPPQQQVVLNWLNIFYAVEWALFAGFAIYLWYRLVRDAQEREVEAANAGEEAVPAGSATGPARPPSVD